MRRESNTKLGGLARAMRKDMTREEKQLWYGFLRTLPVQFKRQMPFGNYILDFFCSEARLAIELDGSQHYTPEGRIKDKERDSYLADHGMLVLHYSNNEINTNFLGVCRNIQMHIDQRKW